VHLLVQYLSFKRLALALGQTLRLSLAVITDLLVQVAKIFLLACVRDNLRTCTPMESVLEFCVSLLGFQIRLS
jgi:hypothetical protein